ncbi:zinc ribbon domain-containing protein [Salinilacihabitans rarus]|uniref:zinc ribbon domain-containing protein n=1 Tax=Salinilacihabitans rarus TaxID=2961596 RepID=UPI0020C83F00|nr:zinc ribbon domain-containing protein [Salinilacihabitans rarus]
MGLSDLLSDLWPGEGTDATPEAGPADGTARSAVYECRNCGTTVDPGTRRCPNCGAEEIASYRVD